MNLEEFRHEYHKQMCEKIIRNRIINGNEIPDFADKDSRDSVRVAQGIVKRLGWPIKTTSKKKLEEEDDEERLERKETSGQARGGNFEKITKSFIESTFTLLSHLRPGRWMYTTKAKISDFEQYEHLARFTEKIDQYPELISLLGTDYIVLPDIVVARYPVDDAEINSNEIILPGSPNLASLTPFRSGNYPHPRPFLHASISCKWTLRSDRAQNARTEALNLIRNRKGNLPHVVAVTGEPLLSRLASLVYGAGDLDCVYHFALREFRETLVEIGDKDDINFMERMIDGKTLRDISDLPFDLAV
jgi:hypothetical protein